MTKSKTVIILSLVMTIAIIFTVIIYNAFGFKRKFNVLISEQYNFCFLVNSDLEYELTPYGFTYKGGKNRGEFTLSRRGFIPGANRVEINGFEAAYKKEKNLRTYQYLVGEGGLILTDRFVYASKSPLNLVPYRKECSKIRENYKQQTLLKLKTKK